MTVLDPLAASRRIADSYRGYLASTFSPRREDLQRDFRAALASDFRLTRGPYLQASPPFEKGAALQQLIDEDVVSSHFADIGADSFPLERSLYLHQEQAIRKAVAGRNLVVATGTGSGKTECFLLPIVNHLLREREAGTLATPGVRALLLYPMNALANDQVKRLRRLLAHLPDITFGRYVGETETAQSAAEQAFRNRYPSEPRLPNELISREVMQETPPHILLTNYAMLEYLLLRPADSALFDGAHANSWRFVVLDEAHVYNGAQGTEIAMLLRRVRDRVVMSEPGRLQCFATSATLGSGERDYPALIDFAQDLFGEPFAYDAQDEQQQDIVSATRLPLVQGDGAYEFPQGTFVELQTAFRGDATVEVLEGIVRNASASAPAVDPGVSRHAYLAAVLRQEAHVVATQSVLETRSAEVLDLADRLFTGPDAATEMVALIDLCAAARDRDDDAPLIPSRYHFFVRSLESAFVCQHAEHAANEPRLRLSRFQQCPSCSRHGRDARMFEVGICRNCRAEYLVGQFADKDGGRVFEMAPDYAPQRRYLLLGDAVDLDDEDQAAVGDGDVASTDQQLLCPGCGTVGDGKARCGCAVPPMPVRVTLVHAKGDSAILRTCVACSTRTTGEVVFRFVTGTDAPVSVVATDLYQAIPPSVDPLMADLVGQGRKLLTFSDSRQDAAFFAPYLERTYRRAVERRLIADAIVGLAARDRPRTEDVIFEVRKHAEKALVLDPDNGRLRNESEVATWVAQEILALDRRQSIEGTGIAEIAVAFPSRYEPPRAMLDLGFSPQEIKDLLQLLLETVRAGAALTMPEGADVRDDRFAPRNFEFALRLQGSEPGVISWLPGSASNRRLEILTKVLAAKGIDADPLELLRNLWRVLAEDPNQRWAKVLVPSSDSRKGALWQLGSKALEFIPISDDHRPSRCDVCQRLWWRNVAGICPGWRCVGHLIPVTDIDKLLDNHYADLYRRLATIGIEVQEHTAQWTAAKASSIQDDFISGRVNVLSCSTTFELGVDVGEVQAVLLRNVPPSPANYVQRAGRAGRRTDSAALVVTFAQRRSHDLTHFDNPSRMVDGTVDPPRILLENPAIVRRHAHSVAFAAFERERADQGELHRNVEDFFVTESNGSATADLRFVDWLRTHPIELGGALGRIVPQAVSETLGLKSWSWVDALVESSDDDPTFGWLGRAGDQIREDLSTVDELYEEAKEADRPGQMGNFQRVRKTLASKPLLSVLATSNVLPKYGFPVDVVDLNLARSGDDQARSLDLSRDLKMAIREFAPGGQVVAAKALWESTGLGMRAGHGWPTYKWAVCADCGAYRQGLERLPECPVCESDKIAMGRTGSYVIPVFGFTGKRLDKVGENRPLRQSATETYFGAYRDEVLELEDVEGLCEHVRVQARTSRQGQIYVINRGSAGRGFRFCSRCGRGEPAPIGKPKKDKAHPNNQRPNRECDGLMIARHLGHQYLTDVAEIRIGLPLTHEQSMSVLYALIEGADALGIARDDIDGTLYQFGKGEPPAFAIFDSVPGGAGHAQRIAEHVPEVVRAALARVETCECGPETSCYTCLRSYANQLHHEQLSRGAAAEVLRTVLGGTSTGLSTELPGVRSTPDDVAKGRSAASQAAALPVGATSELQLLHDSVRGPVRQAIELGAPVPIAGFEVGADEGWSVEVAWPTAKVAIVLDEDGARDAWLIEQGWDSRPLAAWSPDELVNRTTRT